MGLRVIGFQLERLFVSLERFGGGASSAPDNTQVIIGCGHFWTLVDRFLKKRGGFIQFLALQSFDTLKNQIFGLGQARAEIMERLHFAQLGLRGLYLSLGAKRDAEIVPGLLEIRLQLDGTLKSRDSPGKIVIGFQFHADVVLRAWFFRIEPRSLPE